MQIDRVKSHPKAIELYDKGERLWASTDITESASYGYGELDENGFWQYPIYEATDRQPTPTTKEIEG